MDPDLTAHAIDLAEKASRDMAWLANAIFISAAVLALIPPIPLRWRSIWMRTIAITVLVWITSVLFQIYFASPWKELHLDTRDGDSLYDGFGMNWAVMLLGWIVPLAECLAVLGTLKLVVWLARKKAMSAARAGGDGDDD